MDRITLNVAGSWLSIDLQFDAPETDVADRGLDLADELVTAARVLQTVGRVLEARAVRRAPAQLVDVDESPLAAILRRLDESDARDVPRAGAGDDVRAYGEDLRRREGRERPPLDLDDVAEPSDAELAQLEAEPRRCRVCGCTDEDCSQCIERTGEPCSWVDDDLCSACDPAARRQLIEQRAIDAVEDVAVEELVDELSAEVGAGGGADREAPGPVEPPVASQATVALDPPAPARDPALTVPTPRPVDVERACMRLTPLERLNPGVPLARELGIPGRHVAPYVKMARRRSWLPLKVDAHGVEEG